jgi:Ca-activated chloride channel homolog
MQRREALFGLLAVPSLFAQDDKSEPKADIVINPTEVIVPVTVTDDKGRFVSDLDKGDFEVYEDGKRQKIAYFNRDRDQPVVAGFLVDLSNASRIHWAKYQEAAQELVLAMMPGDKNYSGYLVSYANDAQLEANTSSDPEKILAKLRKMKPGGGAALYDALYLAMTRRDLVKGEPIEPRRVIVIIGDGHDTASKKTLNEVLELAQRNLVTIFGVSTIAFGFGSSGEKNLTRLCAETGGRVEYPLNNPFKDVSGQMSKPSDEGNYAIKVGTGGYAAELAKGLFKSIAAVTGEVTTQYILRYIPTEDANADRNPSVFRTITVEVPNLPGVKIRHRFGYYPYAVNR